jgi:hypothetical protein
MVDMKQIKELYNMVLADDDAWANKRIQETKAKNSGWFTEDLWNKLHHQRTGKNY